MADVNANIGVNIDASQALAELKNLQRQISQFHTSIARSSATAAAAQRNLQTDFLNAINATGKFAAEMRTIKTASESFTTSLEKNKFSMGEYFKYAGGASRTFGRLFRTEFDTIQKVAEDRVKKLQTQYIKMGRDANGALKAIAVTPLALDMDNLQTKTMIAAQKQQLFNELLSKGTTNLINFGKNTQWAGRQLMVGFTIPLSIFGSKATQAFLELEQQALRFKRVYGDLFTSTPEINANLEAVRGLAQEYIKYGVAAKDTMSLAADAAAAGMQGAKLQETVRQATKLSVLGEVDKQQAFQATIALQTAFQMSNQQLAESVDFLNAVENQSVTNLQDMTDAIPKVAPVIRGLGGDIKDMAVFLTAMKEGGVDAAEAANGLKSALASMINPSKAAKEMLAGVGIDLQAITERNKGNLMRTVLELGDALKGLEPLARTRVLEKLFGKYQFARVSALFDNISKSGSQAQRTLELMSMSASDLARISNKELTAIEENASTKFKSAVEGLKTAIAPIGDVFLQVITPVLNVITKLADKFSGLSDHTKKVIAVILTVIGGIAPVVLMLVGLFANFFGQIMKFFALIKNGYSSLSGGSKVLGEQTQYLTSAQIEAEAVAASLDQVHAKLTQRFTSEATAVNALRTAYLNAAAASSTFAASNPNMMIPGFRGTPKKYANGVTMVPGTGNTDSVAAMLTPGEAVIPKRQTKKYGALISGIVADNIPGFNTSNVNTGYWTQTRRNQILDALGLTGRERIRIPIAGSNPFYSTSGVMAPSSVNDSSIGMTKGFLQSDVGRAAFEANIQAGLEEFGSSTGRISEIFDEIGPILTGAIDRFDDTTQSWQDAANDAMQVINRNTKISDAEKEVLRKRVAPINPDDYTVGSNKVLEVSRRRAVPRDERINAPARYRSARQLQILKAKFPGMDFSGWEFSHMPGFEKIQGEHAVIGQPSIGTGVKGQRGRTLTPGELQMLAAERRAYEQRNVQTVNEGIETVKRTAGTASPSKRTIPIGEDIAKGLEVGMKNRQKAVKNSAQQVANTAVTGMRDTGLVDKNGRPLLVSSGGGSGNGGGPTFLGMPEMPERRPQNFRERMTSRFTQMKSNIRAMGPMGPARMMMGATSAVMMGSMMPGAVGDFAQKLIPATMGIQALATALPLLTNPIGATVAAFAGLAFLIHKANKAYEAHVKAIQDSAKAEVARQYGGSSSAQAYAKFVGQSLPSAQQFNRIGDARFISADLAKVAGAREFYAQKGNIATRAITKAKPGDQVNAIAQDVAQRAALFNLTPQDIAANIKAASELVGANEFDVKAKIQELLAPGGKDILKEPLTVEAKMNFLNASTNKQLDDLQTRISKLGSIATAQPYGGGRAGAYAYAAQMQASKDKQIRDTAIASELLKNAFFNQTQQLGLLNQQYESGAISQEQYQAALEKTMAGFAGITTSTNDLIAKMNELDTSGKTSKALLSDLADSVLADFTKANKATGAIIKETLAAMPPEIQTNILIALSKGSLQPLEIIQFSDMLKQMDGKTIKEQYQIIANLNGVSESFIIQAKLIVKAKELAEAELAALEVKSRGGKALGPRIKVAGLKKDIEDLKKEADKLAGIDPTKKTTSGTGKLTEDGSSQKSPFQEALDKIRGQATAIRNQIKAYDALKKAKYSDKDATELAADATIAEALAMKLNATQRKQLMAAIQSYNKARKAGDVDAARKSLNNQITQLKEEANALEVLKSKGIDAATALEMLGNESFKTLILATIQAGGNVDELIAKIKEVLSLQALLSGATETPQADKDYEAYNKAYDAAMSYFDAQEAALRASRQAGEDALAANVASAEAALEATEKQIQGVQDLIDAKQDLIDKEQHEIDLLQHQIDLNDQQIASYQRQIELIQRQIDEQFGKPLKALQDESDILNNNLALIDKQAKEINKYYDEQQAALEQVNKLNEQAIQQGKAKISIADALSQGDISAAAQAVQDLRAQEAAANATSMQSALDASRQAAISGITVGGKTKEQIEERLFQIGQEQFKLQQQQKVLEEEIAKIKEKIIPLEDANYQLNLQIEQKKLKIWEYEQEIYKIQVEQLKPLEEKRKKQEQAIKDAEAELKKYKDQTDQLVDQIEYMGKKKKAWDDEKKAVDAAYESIKAATASTEAAAKAAAALLQSYKDLASMGEIHTYVTNHITNVVTTVVNTVAGTSYSAPSGSGSYTDPGTSSGSGGYSSPGTSSGTTTTPTTEPQLVPPRGALDPYAFAFGGRVRKYASGGSIVPGTGLLDSVGALLTPGEFVVNKASAQAYAPLLESINNQTFPAMNVARNAKRNRLSSSAIEMDTKQFTRGGQQIGPVNSRISVSRQEVATDNSSTVYNYQVDININGNNMDSDSIANTVLFKIKELQDTQIRRRLK